MLLPRTTAARRPLFLAAVLGLGLALAPIAGPAAFAAGKLPGYKTEAAAKAACAGDTVVWHARRSKVFHTSQSRYFGKTKGGAYVCEKAALADGLHLSKV